MCGIAGFVSNEPEVNSEYTADVLSSMLKKLHRRGPDHEGSYIQIDGKKSLAFGHRRLSIIDLTDDSNQPTLFDNIHNKKFF